MKNGFCWDDKLLRAAFANWTYRPTVLNRSACHIIAQLMNAGESKGAGFLCLIRPYPRVKGDKCRKGQVSHKVRVEVYAVIF
jgi:hypothetical protein